jgi:hypothetical protein
VRGLFNGQGISPRTAYTMALLTVPAMLGTALGLAMTGKPPESLRDAYFPKTGKKRDDGTDDRISPPSYMKDLAALSDGVSDDPMRITENAAHMAANKLNPLFGTLWETFGKNEDYYGTAVRNPNDPGWKQLSDVGKHLLGAAEPFASRGLRQQREVGQNWLESALPLAGFTPAPGYITHTAAEEKERREKGHYQLSPVQRKEKREVEAQNPEAAKRRNQAQRIYDKVQQGRKTRTFPTLSAEEQELYRNLVTEHALTRRGLTPEAAKARVWGFAGDPDKWKPIPAATGEEQ